VDVAIAGGGLSGPAAVRKLKRAGKSVLILEASEHAAGRIQNADVGGVVRELGGEWVSAFQPHIQALLKELDPQTFETYATGKSTFVYEGSRPRGLRHLLRAGGARADRLPRTGLGDRAVDPRWRDNSFRSGHQD
jgi:monoamine oxidase